MSDDWTTILATPIHANSFSVATFCDSFASIEMDSLAGNKNPSQNH
jgi:hypothetical protein